MGILSWLKTLLSSLTFMHKSKILEPKEFKVSSTKLKSFFRCQRCFYFQYRLGVKLPTLGGSFALSTAVDNLLKNEFDQYRGQQAKHPICIEYGIDAIPFSHPAFSFWRKNVFYQIPNTNITVDGKLDDVWINKKTKELMVVDYKTTSKKDAITPDLEVSEHYKRQVEIYQWILRKKGFSVSNTAYFIYCNGKKDLDRFDKALSFDMVPVSYEGSDSWVEKKIKEAYGCLQNSIIPFGSDKCDYCKFLVSVKKYL